MRIRKIINRVILTGRLTKEPDVSATKDNKPSNVKNPFSTFFYKDIINDNMIHHIIHNMDY